jgi:hypothetical protein
MSEESLRDAVEAHASALVLGDIARFASYMTPQALVQMGAEGGTRFKRYQVTFVAEDGPIGTSTVIFRGGVVLHLSARWERAGDAWRIVAVERVTEPSRAWWRRKAGEQPPTAQVEESAS